MLFSPVTEWRKIGEESSTVGSLLIGYVMPMALIPAVASFIGYGFIGVDGLRFRVRGLFWGSAMAIDSFITSLVVYWVGTYIVDWLGSGFGTKRNAVRAARLVAYSYTPVWIAGVFFLWPSLHGLVALGLYGVYLFYLGIPVLKPVERDQWIGYAIFSAVLLIIIRFLIGLLIVNIIYSFWGDPYLPFSPALF
jgi:hypothetical protein